MSATPTSRVRAPFLGAAALLLSFAFPPTSAVADPAADCAQTADRAKAIAACSGMLTTAAKDPVLLSSIYTNRAAAQQAQGKLDEALSDATRALYNAPKSADLWRRRGEIRLAKGQHIRCAADFAIALKYDPKLAQAFVGRSECYRRLGALPRAIADADAALKIDAGSAPAFASRGYAQLRLGKVDLAITDSEAAIRLDPQSARGYLTRGLAQEKRDMTKATADVRRAVELDPRIKAERGLADILRRFGV